MQNEALKAPYGEKLDKLVVNVLTYQAKGSTLDNKSYLLSLLEGADKKTVASDMNDIVRKMLMGQTYKVSTSTFPIFHGWLEYSGIKSEINRIPAADLILAPIVSDEACRRIILENKDYYKPMISGTQEHTSNLHKKLKAIIKSEPDSEFARYVASITNYEGEEDKK